jgi:hypothetical protein
LLLFRDCSANCTCKSSATVKLYITNLKH